MKNLLILILFITNNTLGADVKFIGSYTVQETLKTKVFKQILANKVGIDLTYARALADSIVVESKKHSINPKLLAAIIAVESMYDHKAVNKVSFDYGIAQINYKTIKAYNFNKQKLVEDLQYSIESSVKVLSYFHKRYSVTEPKDWFVRYNTGTAKQANKSKQGLIYKQLVNKYWAK